MRLIRHLLTWLTRRWGDYARRRAVARQVRRWRADERRRAFGRVENYAREWPWAARTRGYQTTRLRREPRSGGRGDRIGILDD
jgi:hypothetical protein